MQPQHVFMVILGIYFLIYIGQISTIKGIDPSKFGSTMYNIDDYISGRS